MKASDEERELLEQAPRKEVGIISLLKALFNFWKWLTR